MGEVGSGVSGRRRGSEISTRLSSRDSIREGEMRLLLALVVGLAAQIFSLTVFDASSAEGYMTFFLGYIAMLVAIKD